MSLPRDAKVLEPFLYALTVDHTGAPYGALLALQRSLLKADAAYGPPDADRPIGVSLQRGARILPWSTLTENDVRKLDGAIVPVLSGLDAYEVGAVTLLLRRSRERDRIERIYRETPPAGAPSAVAQIAITPSPRTRAGLVDVELRGRTVAAGLDALGLGEAAGFLRELSGVARTFADGRLDLGLGGPPVLPLPPARRAPARRRAR